ncbi:S-adenosyl-L-methionine-dependent methyltransferase [Aspergillus pseudotamarii]|uniref:S-adenosyl-L-methionine-dependent methyltransferase n=1 Tax=Aspergillus pseudotamarii TaxID=132259 RepID=A0A5N6SXR9_ASPPS|nr:S-adenosyl-L-methionine-dependent methyltransferase [Aspergillus pseudotamarii]KAE8137914.1 S-adenosyl-L-methionine-dependent methyltransferase [Aspergillus pseudotamarii]
MKATITVMSEFLGDGTGNRDVGGDTTSGADSLRGDDTTTLATYITDYRFENGPRYYAFRDGACLVSLCWGRHEVDTDLVTNPTWHQLEIHSLQEILDVGTGTGVWVIDMADEYPSARRIGVDLSPIQPSFIPPNCGFKIDDVTLPWTFAGNQFDFIHLRKLFGCIADWDEFFRQCLCFLKPVSDDGSLGPDHFYQSWSYTFLEAARLWGKNFAIWGESADLSHAISSYHRLPRQEGFGLRLLTSTLKWPDDEAQLFLAKMCRCLGNLKTHAYLPVTVVVARKPDPTVVEGY